jgi:hypothetical protein
MRNRNLFIIVRAKRMSKRRFLSETETLRIDHIFDYLIGNVGTDLGEGDIEFLTSTQKFFKKDGKLSDAQIEILEKIYARY